MPYAYESNPTNANLFNAEGLPASPFKIEPNDWPGPDYNGDNVVNFFDYGELGSGWGTGTGEPGYDERYDLHDNNAVDMNDLRIFLEDWLWGL